MSAAARSRSRTARSRCRRRPRSLLLKGVPIYSAGPQVELTTPTGALLVSDYAKEYGPTPAMTHRPYRLRRRNARLPERAQRRPRPDRRADGRRADANRTVVLKIECEIDDMNPQLFAPASDRLFEAGALDVFLTAVSDEEGHGRARSSRCSRPRRAGRRSSTSCFARRRRSACRFERSRARRSTGDGSRWRRAAARCASRSPSGAGDRAERQCPSSTTACGSPTRRAGRQGRPGRGVGSLAPRGERQKSVTWFEGGGTRLTLHRLELAAPALFASTPHPNVRTSA